MSEGIMKDYMTVQQVMQQIRARARSTITRMIEQGKLEADLIPGHGWLVRRKSVAKMLEKEAGSKSRVGRPRGQPVESETHGRRNAG